MANVALEKKRLNKLAKAEPFIVDLSQGKAKRTLGTRLEINRLEIDSARGDVGYASDGSSRGTFHYFHERWDPTCYFGRKSGLSGYETGSSSLAAEERV